MRISALWPAAIAATVAGCAAPAATPPTAPTSPTPTSATAGAYPVSERVTLFTHCGITAADLDGLYWVALSSRPAPEPLPGPGGITRVTGTTAGVWTRTAPDQATFVVDDPTVVPDPTPVRFRVAPPPTNGRCL